MDRDRRQQKARRCEKQLLARNETLEQEFNKFWDTEFERWNMIDHKTIDTKGCLNPRIWDWRPNLTYQTFSKPKQLNPQLKE